jgi:hypothetical protein
MRLKCCLLYFNIQPTDNNDSSLAISYNKRGNLRAFMTNQSAPAVLMVRPVSFGFDDQTAKTNVFQHHIHLKDSRITQKALEEFEDVVETLQKLDIDVLVFEDESHMPKPNGVFVNNWLSTWPDGAIYLYPMATESRRTERDQTALELIKQQFVVKKIVDISSSERDEKFLESTGVIVFDHLYKYAYACLSGRCDEQLLRQHLKELQYRPVIFHAVDRHNVPIYHTNVVLSIQSSTAIVCSEVVKQQGDLDKLFKALTDSGRTIVDISEKQMENFCGNVLEVQSRKGKKYLILSQTAMDNLTPDQQRILGTDKTLVPIQIPTIETVGGGSARCMMAEIFLPPKA